MAPVKNGKLLFNERPEGLCAIAFDSLLWLTNRFVDYPIPGKTTVYDESETLDVDNVPLNGGYLLKVLCLSIDPYMRGRMKDSNSYVVRRTPPITLFSVHSLPPCFVRVALSSESR